MLKKYLFFIICLIGCTFIHAPDESPSAQAPLSEPSKALSLPDKPEISYIDRDGTIVPEEFPYHKELKLFNKIPGNLVGQIAKSKTASQLMGWAQNNKTLFSISWSKFAEKHSINLEECIIPEAGYRSFNDFFTRKLKPGARTIDQTPGGIVSPADAKVTFVQDVSKKDIFIIKNSKWSLKKMLGNQLLAEIYEGGTLISFRLAPEDYHRFHFPIDATPGFSKKISGKYDSVNPYVFKHGFDPLGENARDIVVLKSEEFCDPICIVVGAMGVGKIVENYTPYTPYKKGDEMGYFKFGASTVCLLFKKGIIQSSQEKFISNSQKMIETAVKQGQLIAIKASKNNSLPKAQESSVLASLTNYVSSTLYDIKTFFSQR